MAFLVHDVPIRLTMRKFCIDFPGANTPSIFESLERRQDLIGAHWTSLDCSDPALFSLFSSWLDFLIAEVQIYRIIQARKEDNDLMDTDEEIHRPPERIVRPLCPALQRALRRIHSRDNILMLRLNLFLSN